MDFENETPLDDLMRSPLTDGLDEYVLLMNWTWQGKANVVIFSRCGEEFRVRRGGWNGKAITRSESFSSPSRVGGVVWDIDDYVPKLDFESLLHAVVHQGAREIGSPSRAVTSDNWSNGVAVKYGSANGETVVNHYFVHGSKHVDDPRHMDVVNTIEIAERKIERKNRIRNRS